MASMPMTDLNLHPNPTLLCRYHQRNHRGCRVRLITASDRKGNSDVKHTTLSWIVPITSPPPPPLIHLRHRRNCVGNYDGNPVPTEVASPPSNLGKSRPEDSYIGVFIQMLGLYSDPLDREQAVTTLWKYVLGGRQCVDNVMKFSGCINLIVNLLKSDSPFSCEASAGLLQSISSVDIYRKTVAQSGAIEEITGVLLQTTLTPEVIGRCVFTLYNLSVDEELRVKIAKSDLLPVLIKLLDHEEIKLKEAAGGVLANLALSRCNHDVMVEAGVIPMLAKLLKYDAEGHSVVRKEAKNALMELSKDEFYKILIIEADLMFVPIIGAEAYKSLRPTTHLWPSLPDGTEIERTPTPSRYGASELLLGLHVHENSELEEAKMEAVVGRSRQQFLARIGAIESEEVESSANEQQTLLPLIDGVARLVLILELEDVSAISRAARSISDVLISEEIRRSFKAAGAVPRLLQLLDHNDNAVREAAISAIEKLSVSPEVCQMFKEENMFTLLSRFIKSAGISQGIKEKTVNILARISNPDKVMKVEFGDKLINGSGKLLRAKSDSQIIDGMGDMSVPQSPSQTMVMEKIVDSGIISCLVEIMKTSSPNVQIKAASILEHFTSSDVHLSALTGAGLDSALYAILQRASSMSDLEDGNELEEHGVSNEESGLVIAAASRLLAKMLNFDVFRHETNFFPFVDVLRKILKSGNLTHGKEWVATCLVKINLIVGSDGVDVEVIVYEAIPRLIVQMKSPSSDSYEAALVELKDIFSRGITECSAAFAAAGGIFPLVELIKKIRGSSLEAGLAVLNDLSMNNENHAAIIAAGAIPVLKRIVNSEGSHSNRALHLMRMLPV